MCSAPPGCKTEHPKYSAVYREVGTTVLKGRAKDPRADWGMMDRADVRCGYRTAWDPLSDHLHVRPQSGDPFFFGQNDGAEWDFGSTSALVRRYIRITSMVQYDSTSQIREKYKKGDIASNSWTRARFYARLPREVRKGAIPVGTCPVYLPKQINEVLLSCS